MKLYNIILGSLLLFVGIPGVFSLVFYLSTRETFEATINQVNRSSLGGIEVLLAEDPFDWGVIRNEDNLFILKFNSGVLSGKMFSGAKCTLTTYGWRNTLLGWKPNLIRIEKCSKP